MNSLSISSGDINYSGPFTQWTPAVAGGAAVGSSWTTITVPSTTVWTNGVQAVPYGGGSGGWQAIPSTPSVPFDYEQMIKDTEELRRMMTPMLSDDELEMLEAVNKWKKYLGI